MGLSSIPSSAGNFPTISSGTTTTGSPTPEDKTSSLQDSQLPDKNSNSSQKISLSQHINPNQDLSQNLSTIQDLTTNSDLDSSEDTYNDQNTAETEESVSPAGLSSDQRISHNSREGQNSTGSGEHSHQDQKDFLKTGYASHTTPSSTTVTSIHQNSTTTSSSPRNTETTTARYQNSQQLSPAARSHVANTIETKAKNLGLDAVLFKVDKKVINIDKKVITTAEDIDTKTLQVDKKIITTAENINSKVLTVEFMKNAAPALKEPPYPNVYEMILLAQELSTNTLGLTITAMVAANNGMSAEYSDDLKTQIQDINKAIADNQNTGNKANSEIGKIFGWVMVAVMYVAAAVLIATGAGVVMGAALLATAIMMTVMMTSAGAQLTNGLAYGLQEMGLPKKDCQIVASVLIAVIMIAVTCGVGAFADVLAAASEAAVIATEDAAVLTAEDVAMDTTDDGIELTTFSKTITKSTSPGEDTSNAGEPTADTLASAKKVPDPDDLEGFETISLDDESATEVNDIASKEEEDAIAKVIVEKSASASTKAEKSTLAQVRYALSKPEGRAAFRQSIEKSLWENGVKSIGKAAWDAPSNIAKGIVDASTSIGKAGWDAGASVMNSEFDAMSIIQEASHAMNLKNASLFFESVANKMRSFASDSLSAMYKSPTSFQEALNSRAELLKTILSQVDIFNKPVESAYIIARYLESSLSIGNALMALQTIQTSMELASDVEGFKAAQQEYQDMVANSTILHSQATTNSINEQMQLSAKQINTILQSISDNTKAAAAVFAGITTADPLLDLNTRA